jgi:antitoxin (DNA-binding transcriptional repressor) of toxin-antitoxin stability system
MTITIEEAQRKLPELIAGLKPGDELIITAGARPVAQVLPLAAARLQPRQPGSAKGLLTILAEDDEHLEDFKEYME